MPRNKALLIGINEYLNFPDQSLEGCVNDVDDLNDVLVKSFQVDPGDITIFRDAEATKDAMKQAMYLLLDGAEADDRLLFHFSGHGSFNSPNGDPPDGFKDGLVVDGVLCPHDFNFGQPNTYLTDEELRAWTQTLPSGADLVVILDSCHSGGGTRELRLPGKGPYLIDEKATNNQVERQATMATTSAERNRVLAATIPAKARQKRARFLLPPKVRPEQIKVKSILRPKDDTKSMNHLLLAACGIYEVAGDVSFNGRPNGVFTHFLCASLNNADPSIVRQDLKKQIQAAIDAGQWNQTPRFEARSLEEPFFSDDTSRPVDKKGKGGVAYSDQSRRSYPPHPPLNTPGQDGGETDRRRLLIENLQGRRLEDAYLRPDLREQILAEAQAAANDPDTLLDGDSINLLNKIVAARRTQQEPLTRSRGFSRAVIRQRLFSSASVVVVPGFLASQLSDKQGGNGLIWINPLDALSDRLSILKMAPLQADGSESDADTSVSIMPEGPLPVIYDLLRASLETSIFGPRYATSVFAFDWRRNLEDAAQGLIAQLGAVKSQAPSTWPLHVVAHSQGALVARRAIQLMENQNNQLVDRLVLLGPANFGSMAAVQGLGDEAGELKMLRKFAVEPAGGFDSVLGTMSGLYQLIPSVAERLPWLTSNPVGRIGFWGSFPIDKARLEKFFGWPEQIDTSFFNDRTAIILGDNNGDPTVGGVFIDDLGNMQVDGSFGLEGDGTITHSCAVLRGVATYVTQGTEHARLPTYPSVIQAVHDLLNGKEPSLDTAPSTDPKDYITPIPTTSRSLSRGLTRGLTLSARPRSVGRTPEPPDALKTVIDSMADVATRSGARIRFEIEVDPSAGR